MNGMENIYHRIPVVSILTKDTTVLYIGCILWRLNSIKLIQKKEVTMNYTMQGIDINLQTEYT